MYQAERKRVARVFCYMLYVACYTALLVPSVVFALHERGHLFYVPCGDQYYTKVENPAKESEVKNPCGFGDVIAIASSIINGWIGAGVIVATMGFAYAGFLYITAAGSEESIKHAHSIFVKVLIGFTLMLGAWLIAKAFETAFLNEAAKARSFLAN